jgi:hypothetical protein
LSRVINYLSKGKVVEVSTGCVRVLFGLSTSIITLYRDYDIFGLLNMPTKKICITFAGAIGSSKSPIANYLSPKLGLPIFNNDAIRSEVIEDLGNLDNEEHLKRRDARLKEIIENGTSFIIDASVDRTWSKLKESLQENGYDYFIISLDLSKNLLERLYKAKGYTDSLKIIDELMQDHQKFLDEFGGDVGVHITDAEFEDRLEVAHKAVEKWMRN